MKAAISFCDSESEYYFEEGCFINELSNSNDDLDVSIARARVEPGKTTRLHRLRDTNERYVILEGCGQVEIEGLDPTRVDSGDVVIIPAGAAQRISNVGEDDLVFLAICSPRFRPEAYEDLEA